MFGSCILSCVFSTRLQVWNSMKYYEARLSLPYWEFWPRFRIAFHNNCLFRIFPDFSPTIDRTRRNPLRCRSGLKELRFSIVTSYLEYGHYITGLQVLSLFVVFGALFFKSFLDALFIFVEFFFVAVISCPLQRNFLFDFIVALFCWTCARGIWGWRRWQGQWWCFQRKSLSDSR